MFQIQGLFIEGFGEEHLAAIASLAQYLRAHLGTAPDLRAFHATQSHVYEIQAMGAKSLHENTFSDRTFACKAGCDSCCRATDVDMTPMEAFYLASHILEAGLFRANGRFAIPNREANGDACPLLDDEGLCRVYEGRPLSCRYIQSTERAACLARLRTGLGGAKLPPPFSNFRTSISAAQFVMLRALGLDARWLVLDKTIGNIMNLDDLAAGWLAGEPLPEGLGADLPEGEFLRLVEAVEEMSDLSAVGSG